MATNTKIMGQSKALNNQIANSNRIENKIQTNIPTITPAIPSPRSEMSNGDSKPPDKSGSLSRLILSVILPMSSLSFIPLYSPTDRKRKNARDKILVDKIEFSKIVRCWPSPRNQMDKMVNAATTRLTVKTVLVVTSLL